MNKPKSKVKAVYSYDALINDKGESDVESWLLVDPHSKHWEDQILNKVSKETRNCIKGFTKKEWLEYIKPKKQFKRQYPTREFLKLVK